MAAKKNSKDDELFPDTGEKKKTQTRKVEKAEKLEKAEKAEKKTTKVEKALPKEKPPTKVEKALPKEKPPTRVEKALEPEPAAEKPAKLKSGPVKALEPEAAPKGMPKGVKALIGAMVLAGVVGAAALVGPALIATNDGPKPPKLTSAKPVPPPRPLPKAKPDVQAPIQPAATAKPVAKALTPVALATPKPRVAVKKGKTAKELGELSPSHAAIASVLERFDALRKVNLQEDNRLFEDYQAKQKKELELIDEVRRLGPAAVLAMKQMLLEIDDDGYRILLAKALGGMKDQDALKATADILSSCHDIAVQTTLARYLPDGPDSLAVVGAAFAQEQNPNVRSMLLREYARRLGDADPSVPDGMNPALDAARAAFRAAATDDPDPSVRAEAVAIIGRRGDPRDMDLMAQIAKNEPNLQIRQSAIVAYATTGNQDALPTLGDLARTGDSVEIRASAVLGIARVGGDAAIQILDQIAQTDPSDAIRQRATSFAQGLRAKAQSDRNDQNNPNRINPAPVPLTPRGRG